MNKKLSEFDDFWEASKLNRYNMPEYASRINFYVPDENLYKLEYPLAPRKLFLPKGKLQKLTQKRSSQRSFSDKQLKLKDLGRLLSSMYAIHNTKSRTYPSAGASYALEAYALCFHVAGIKQNSILYYDPNEHGIVPIKEGEGWDEVKGKVNVEVEGSPQVLLLVAFIQNRLTDKYGERGSRFALLEAGAAMQHIALTIAEHDLHGVVAGGMFDEYWIKMLGLSKMNAKLAFGYLIGK